MSNTKNTALAKFSVFMNSFERSAARERKEKDMCQMRTSENADENNREMPDAGLRRKIEERAYHIWLENGGGHGDHERHWLQAERELAEATKRRGKPQSDARSNKKTAKPR